jgi:uncharacterized membrane protein YqjE
MITQQRTLQHRGDGRNQRMIAPAPEPPVGDLIRQLGTEGATLVRSEVALAKLEFREMARGIVLDSAMIFGALTLALAGVLALLAGTIIALGNALDGRYALAAFIVGAIMFLVGAFLARTGIAGFRSAPKPEQTVATLRSTTHWVKDEITDFKDEIRS